MVKAEMLNLSCGRKVVSVTFDCSWNVQSADKGLLRETENNTGISSLFGLYWTILLVGAKISKDGQHKVLNVE